MMRAARSPLAQWGAEGDAILVETDRPWRLVLWEKAQYVPCWDLGDDIWFSTEWLETHSPESRHCWEPIMDKACRYSRARIVESGPARATVRWDYALCDSKTLSREQFRCQTVGEDPVLWMNVKLTEETRLEIAIA